MTCKPVLGYLTFPDDACAARVCEALVTEDLIACANILAPHRSFYKWDGELKHEAEVAAILKTDSSRIDRVVSRVRELHPFDTPALSFVEIVGGDPGFLSWLGARAANPDRG